MEKPKARAPKSTVLVRPNSEFSAKAQREKKKERRWYDQQQQQQEDSIPATGVNVTKPGELHPKKSQKNRNCLDRVAPDLSHVKCYNCQKIGYYATKCLELLKN